MAESRNNTTSGLEAIALGSLFVALPTIAPEANSAQPPLLQSPLPSHGLSPSPSSLFSSSSSSCGSSARLVEEDDSGDSWDEGDFCDGRIKGKQKAERKHHAGTLPVEILDAIFEVVVARAAGEGRKLAGFTLASCARTCRLWASVAIPTLYKNAGFGVFEYIPPQPYRRQASFACVPYSEQPFARARVQNPSLRHLLQQARYWRTLLLSALWQHVALHALAPTSRLTLYPYLNYIEHLDFSVIAWLVDMSRHWDDGARRIREALFAIGGWEEALLVETFEGSNDAYGATPPWELSREVLATIIRVLAPQVGHLRSASVFSKEAIVASRGWDDAKFDILCTQPMISLICSLTRLTSLEICGQEHINESFGIAISKLKPPLIGPGSRSTKQQQPFTLRLTGPRRLWGQGMSDEDYLKSDKAFLDAINVNSVTCIDFDIGADWGWTLDHISDFMLRQARTLRSISLKGVGDTVMTWQMFDRMGKRGCRVRALALENRHVHHPPVVEPTAWSFKSAFLRKLKHFTVHSFLGITNSTTNYHMIDPTAFTILLRNHLFSGSGAQMRPKTTPPLKTLVLPNIRLSPKVPEQVGAFVMRLSSTLTTLDITYLQPQRQGGESEATEALLIAHSQEQGRYTFIEALAKLKRLRRLRVKGFSAEILLCACVAPQIDGASALNSRKNEDIGGDKGEESSSSSVLHETGLTPHPAQRPSTPPGNSATFPLEESSSPPSNLLLPTRPSLTQRQEHPHRTGGPWFPRKNCPSLPGVPPAQHLFTDIWVDTIEEIELTPTFPIIFTENGGLKDDALMMFAKLQKLRVLVLDYGEPPSPNSGNGNRGHRGHRAGTRRRRAGGRSGSSAEFYQEDEDDEEGLYGDEWAGYGDDDFDEDDEYENDEEEEDYEDDDERPASSGQFTHHQHPHPHPPHPHPPHHPNHHHNNPHPHNNHPHPPQTPTTTGTSSSTSGTGSSAAHTVNDTSPPPPPPTTPASSSRRPPRRRLSTRQSRQSPTSSSSSSGTAANVPRGDFTTHGVVKFIDSLPRREHMWDQTILQRFVLSERYLRTPAAPPVPPQAVPTSTVVVGGKGKAPVVVQTQTQMQLQDEYLGWQEIARRTMERGRGEFTLV
ncbi:hypothetical protein DFH27DRAFT_97108 [Peziza echinospora]|nr:hypothetical protein DFH27DRAFT_97108 [Peziza echinospora]